MARLGIVSLTMVMTVVALSVLAVAPATAKVFFSKKSALAEAFPGADAVDQVNLFLSAADAEAITASAGTPWPNRLTNAYVGRKGGAVLGYAFIDTHRVRSLDETLMIVVRPEGTIERVLMLAFHEPAEYLPSGRWMAQFIGRALDRSMSMRTGEIDGISGATLTARAVTASVRRVLALHARKVGLRAAAATSGSSTATPR